VLKQRPDTARIPVLIATAGSLTLQQLDAADGFMVKPFRMELLFSILDHMLGRKDGKDGKDGRESPGRKEAQPP
jgi:hypothetical protein